MSRTALTVNDIVRTGTGLAVPSESAGDSGDGNSVANDGRVFLLVHNTGVADDHTLTVSLPKTFDGQSVVPRTYTLVATASKYIGPFPVSYYGSSLSLDVDDAELHLTPFRLP